MKQCVYVEHPLMSMRPLEQTKQKTVRKTNLLMSIAWISRGMESMKSMKGLSDESILNGRYSNWNARWAVD